MKVKCSIYHCQKPAQTASYCRDHYERRIEPSKSLTKTELREFVIAVSDLVERQLRRPFPRELAPGSADNLTKNALRVLYRETQRWLDTKLRPTLPGASDVWGWWGLMIGPDTRWSQWEALCVQAARTLFGRLLLQPRLPNGTVPDIVPVVRGLKTQRSVFEKQLVTHAPLVIEIKQGALHGPVRPKYGRFADHIEVWFYRWKPRWMRHPESGVRYQTAIEIAGRLDRAGNGRLGRKFRLLPILWRNYELFPHFSSGLTYVTGPGEVSTRKR
jgi:hypothetical protein